MPNPVPDVVPAFLGPETRHCADLVRGTLHDLIRAAENEQDAGALMNAERVLRTFRVLFPECSPHSGTPCPNGEHGGGDPRGGARGGL